MVQKEGMIEKKKKKDKKKLETNDSVSSSIFTGDGEMLSQSSPKKKRKNERMDSILENTPESIRKTKKKKRTDNQDSQNEGMSSPSMHKNQKQCIDTDIAQESSPGTKMKKKRKSMDSLDSPVVMKSELQQEHLLASPKTNKKKMVSLDILGLQKKMTSTELQDTPQTTKKQTEGSPELQPKSPKTMKVQHSTLQEDFPSVTKKLQNDGSPKKKKKNKKMSSYEEDTSFNDMSLEKGNLENEDDNDNVEGEDKEWWTEEETKALLDRVEEQLPDNDRRRYRRALNYLDWEALATDTRSDEDCKKKLLYLISTYLKCLKLQDMMTGLRKLVDEGLSNKKKRCLSAHNLFMKEYLTPKRLAKIKAREDKVPMMTVVAEAWRNLPEEKQEIFRKQAMEMKLECSLLEKKRSKPMKAKKLQVLTPLKVWVKEQKAEGIKGEKELTQTAFNELQDEEKIRHIITSLEMYQKYLKNQGKDVKSIGVTGEEEGDEEGEGEVEQQKMPAGFRLSRSSLLLYLKHERMPSFPPPKVTTFFCYELDKSGYWDEDTTEEEKLRQASKLYIQLSLEEKRKHKEKHDKAIKDFMPTIEKWLQKKDPITSLAFQLYTEHLPKFLLREKKEEPEKKILFPNVSETCIVCPKFHGEPQRPPATAYQLFSLKFNEANEGKFESVKDMNQARYMKWKKMSVKKRAPVEKLHQELNRTYRSELLNYVYNMDKKMRSVYLGFARKRHYQHFKEDIFQEIYPNEKYPVYETKIAIPKQELSPVRKTYEFDSSDVNSEGSEEEGNDAVESHLSTKRKTNGMVSKTATLTPYNTKNSKKNVLPSLTRDDQSEESSSEEEEDIPSSPVKKKKQSLKKVLATRYPEREESSDDESDEEHHTTSGTGVQHHPYPNTDSDDSESEDDSYQNKSIMPVYKAAKGVASVSLQKTFSSESEDDSDSD